ncbi:MAG: polysaccharide biosynthesis protein [Actinobacteria bacterium]|nr:polysaccharide biosynthesis protein [Actinomycetota bacterium]
MTRNRQWYAILADAAAVLLAYYVSVSYYHGGRILSEAESITPFLAAVTCAMLFHVGANALAAGYRIIPRYIGLAEALRLFAAAVAAGVALVAPILLVSNLSSGLPVASIPIGAMGAFVVMGAWRFGERIITERRQRPQQQAKDRVLLVGAGAGADMLIREIRRMRGLDAEVVGLVDDNPRLTGLRVQGCPVLGTPADISALVATHNVSQIIIAIPSATPKQLADIYLKCREAGLPVKMAPSLTELIRESGSPTNFRDLEITDLLDRPKVHIDPFVISHRISGKRVLVTGAGGSIGSELVRQVARYHPERLVLVDHDESALYELHEQLQTLGFDRYALFPANIQEERKLEAIFAKHLPDIVFHSAAYKHVPIMERAPDEAVLNNIRGTQLVARTAARFGCLDLVNISTDKAVDPICVMGATKRACELLIRALSRRHTNMRMASVRFGNVLGSQGSVVPVFRKQIENGGPVVVTHPNMKRYFMTIQEAVQLVLHAVILMEENELQGSGADVYILEMGDPISIVELAHQMINLLRPPDHEQPIAIQFTGLRPGEKMDEVLVWGNEEALPTSHLFIRRAIPKAGADFGYHDSYETFESEVQKLIKLAALRAPHEQIVAALEACVSGYRPPETAKSQSRYAVLSNLHPFAEAEVTETDHNRRTEKAVTLK